MLEEADLVSAMTPEHAATLQRLFPESFEKIHTLPGYVHGVPEVHSTEWGAPGEAPQGWALFAAQPFVRAMMDPDHEIDHWSEFDRGGHFPAMEVPGLLIGDVREFFHGLR
jgi:hypothetical protein